jgi:aquaporin Z
MEGAEIAILCTCICGTSLYSRDAPLEDVDRWHISRPMLMGIGTVTTTLLIITSPFGRGTGAYFNPAVTRTFFWLGRGHRWDATC